MFKTESKLQKSHSCVIETTTEKTEKDQERFVLKHRLEHSVTLTVVKLEWHSLMLKKGMVRGREALVFKCGRSGYLKHKLRRDVVLDALLKLRVAMVAAC